MKKVLFITNYPAPYRVCFYDQLGKHLDVTVLFSEKKEDRTHRDADWFIPSDGGFRMVQLTKVRGSLKGRDLCVDVIDWLKKPWDAIVVCGYSSPTCMLAMAWLKFKKIPFYLEVDGGLIREDSGIRYHIKKLMISAPDYWISSGREASRYLCHYGAKQEKMFTYPFTSLWQRDIPDSVPTRGEKLALREKLGMAEEKIVLYVGRFSQPKGMDDLLAAAPRLPEDAGIYFVGGQPGEDHLRFCREQGLDRVHFVGFKKKEELKEYYQAADLLVLPTWSDVWGLVINEAMASGLPVVTTDRCVAGVELIREGENGYVVPIRDQDALVEKISLVLSSDYAAMGRNALETIRPYTIENMADAHVKIFT